MSTQTTELVVRKSITVDCSVEHAFETFTARIGEWWPLERHSITAGEGGGPPQEAVFEPHVGGRVYERTSGGEELAWAEVTAWEPPHRLALSWNPSRDQTPPRTDIEVRFTAEDGKTRVEVEHRGWERFGDRATEIHASYDGGWNMVLGRFVDAANAG